MKQPSPSLEQAAENWQRCVQDELPRAFYAYSAELRQSERVVTYRLAGQDNISAFTEAARKSEKFQFAIHLGLRTPKLSRRIPEEPAFILFIQFRVAGNEGPKDNCFALEWVPNSKLSARNADRTSSSGNAITPASAYLFTQAWLELPYDELDQPFVADLRFPGRRVKSYIHSLACSECIKMDFLKDESIELTVHMGTGTAIWEHPFSFRPVIELSKPTEDVPRPLRFSPGPADGDSVEDSFYDFADPEPPGTIAT